jgi:hypothetical protein
MLFPLCGHIPSFPFCWLLAGAPIHATRVKRQRSWPALNSVTHVTRSLRKCSILASAGPEEVLGPESTATSVESTGLIHPPAVLPQCAPRGRQTKEQREKAADGFASGNTSSLFIYLLALHANRVGLHQHLAIELQISNEFECESQRSKSFPPQFHLCGGDV